MMLLTRCVFRPRTGRPLTVPLRGALSARSVPSRSDSGFRAPRGIRPRPKASPSVAVAKTRAFPMKSNCPHKLTVFNATNRNTPTPITWVKVKGPKGIRVPSGVRPISCGNRLARVYQRTTSAGISESVISAGLGIRGSGRRWCGLCRSG